MRKLIIILTVLFCTSFAFAEPAFMNIPFSLTEEKNKTLHLENKVRENIKIILAEYCTDAYVDFFYNSNKKLHYIKISISTFDNKITYQITKTFFLERGFKLDNEGYLYNKEFLIKLDYDPRKDFIMYVYDRESFLSKFELLF